MAVDYTKRPSAGAAAPAGAPVAPPASPGVSLSKISLTKSSPSVSLTKQEGHMRVNLNWQARPAAPAGGGGFLKRLAMAGSGGIDLDLGCLYELNDGSKGVVQALGNSFGSMDSAPYIWLNGDDRSGTNVAGEDMFINLAHAAQIKRVLVFAFIYEGVPNFEAAQAVVTLSPPAGVPIEVRLDEAAGKSPMCAIAVIEGGSELTVRREVRYIAGGQRALDEAYGWGMNWARGRK